MIYKVLYQEDSQAAPLRENTQSLFIEADSRREVIHFLENNKPYIIEHIEEMSDEHLQYEKKHHPNFEVERI